MNEPTDSKSGDDVVTFDALNLNPDTRRAVDELGYTHPTPVQRAVFEVAQRGGDLVVQARTGTGKTSAFGLPMVNSLVRRDLKEVQGVVLCPTRELALQVTRELSALSKYSDVRVVAVYGGAPMGRQIEILKEGVHILVGTPGRVLDHIKRRTLNLDRVRSFVLDESDEMLSMGFLPQISEIWSHLPKAHQTLLFSATLPPDIQRVAESRLKDPEFITLSGDHIGALEIQHFVYICPGDKLSALIQVVEAENPESAIIFCNTRDETKRVTSALTQQGFSADWLNADLAQNEREKVMEATRKGELRYLVATDVAARGIDISHLTHVINHDFPDSAESYVHRTGRTGRAGRTGQALSLIAPSDIGRLYMLRLTYKIFPIERTLPSARELKSREEADLVNLFVSAFAGRSIHKDDLALARRVLTHESAERVVAGLLRDHLGARPEAAELAKAERRSKRPRSVEEASAPARGAQKPRPADAEASPTTGKSAESNAPAEVASEAPSGEKPPPRQNRKRPERGERREPSERRGERRDGRERTEQRDGRERAERRGSRERKEPDDKLRKSRAEGEVFVNVGRKDGAHSNDIRSLLEEQGFEETEIEYIRVKPSHTFIGVAKDLERRAVNALDGAVIAGKTVSAEPAKKPARDAAPAATEDAGSEGAAAKVPSSV